MSIRPFGRTDLTVSDICVGTSALGSFPAQYGYEVDEDTAVATIQRVFDGPFTFIDTSNEYGGGASEERIGRAIAERGGIPEGYVVATKVDPLPGSTDFSGDRVRRSVEESLERLGLDNLQLVYLHDPEKISFEEGVAKGGPLEALIDLRDQGVIQYLGVAGGPIDLELQYLATDAFDAVISHNRYTLVEQTAEPLLEDAARRGVAFVNAAPFGGGMLVKGPRAVPTYCYAPVARRRSTASCAWKTCARSTASRSPQPPCSSPRVMSESHPRSSECPSRAGSSRRSACSTMTSPRNSGTSCCLLHAWAAMASKP